MRSIVSAIRSTTNKLDKWLTDVFEKLPVSQPSLSVKNSLGFINFIKNVTSQIDEMLIYFDEILYQHMWSKRCLKQTLY